MNLRIRTVIGLTALAATVVSAPALASAERMQLTCTGGDLVGITLERTNGASWWDQEGSVYTTRSIRVTHVELGTVYEHTYGQKSGPAQSCVAEHFGFTWDVEVVAAGAR